jgi:hypothetical protein
VVFEATDSFGAKAKKTVHRCRLPLEAAPSVWVSALGSSLFAGWEFACPRNRRRSIYGQE